MRELVQDVDLDGSDRVLVERVVADAQYSRVYLDRGRGRVRRGREREADEAVVDAAGEVGVGREPFGRDVGRRDAELHVRRKSGLVTVDRQC
jgi:hypothetical protein